MKQSIFRTLLIFASAILVACGGGGDSATTPAAATTVTGKFVDATVVGLGYRCGASSTQTGLTNASGEYTCNTGQSVTFVVGGIVLGSVSSPLAVVTPLDLVGVGASPSNPVVSNIVRFLMSVSSSAPSSGTITIASSVATAASATTVNFTSISLPDLNNVILNIKPGATVFTAADAANHLTGSLNRLFAGNYSGTYSGALAGTWQITFGSNGAITSGSYNSPQTGPGVVGGTLGSTLGAGQTYVYTGYADEATWTGTLNLSTRKFSGSWSLSGIGSGTFTN